MRSKKIDRITQVVFAPPDPRYDETEILYGLGTSGVLYRIDPNAMSPKWVLIASSPLCRAGEVTE